MLLLLLYIVVASAVVYASIRASHYIDLIDRTTNLSGAFLGGVLLSAVTSLPELFTSLSAVLVLHKPSMCIGNILGSDLFNIAMLCCVMLCCIGRTGNRRTAKGNIAVAVYLAVIYAVMMADRFGFIDIELGTVNIITFIFIVIYVLAVRHLSGESSAPDAGEESEPVTLSLRAIAVRFVLASIAIIGLSIAMTYVTDAVAEEFSIGAGFAGALLLGVATSLPEVSSTIALFRMKNYDIAVGNIVGSNLFNFMVLCVADIASFRTSVYDYSDPKVDWLLFSGSVATLLMLPVLTVRNKAVKAVCSLAVIACYILFLLME
ncbi:MAG: sodium:calcium antiporter [Alistipes sp.]|nr:sodium:calcium antiporter [Alistipes sp.]